LRLTTPTRPTRKLFTNPRPQLLDSHLSLQHTSHARAPRLVQRRHLCADGLLAVAALQVDQVDVALCGSQVALQGLQLGLEGVVSEQPGVLAPAIEQGEVGVARGEVGLGDGGGGQGG
jgi:hypothetical protein